jgi:tetratricopeptide (TPR) repeat protein
LQRSEEALADLNQAIALAPTWPLPYLNRIPLQIECDNLNAAIADCNHVLSLVGDPQGEEKRRYAAAALWNRGTAYYRQGNQKQADADYRAAGELDPRFAQHP